jgi:hypothetical protein
MGFLLDRQQRYILKDFCGMMDSHLLTWSGQHSLCACHKLGIGVPEILAIAIDSNSTDNALADNQPADYRCQVMDRLSPDYRLLISRSFHRQS